MSSANPMPLTEATGRQLLKKLTELQGLLQKQEAEKAATKAAGRVPLTQIAEDLNRPLSQIEKVVQHFGLPVLGGKGRGNKKALRGADAEWLKKRLSAKDAENLLK